MNDDILHQILNELKGLKESQNSVLNDIQSLKDIQNSMLNEIQSLKDNQKSMLSEIQYLKDNQNSMKSDISEIKAKVDAINEQTANLTEFKTETIDKLDNITDDLDFLTYKELQTEKEIFKLRKKIIK